MEQKPLINVKQRIVGAIVIVSLMVIVLPIFLNQENIKPLPMHSSDIPDMPKELKRHIVQINNNENSVLSQMPTIPKTKTLPVDEYNTAAYPEQVENSAARMTGGPHLSSGESIADDIEVAYQQHYAIEVASFTNKHKALELMNDLLKKNIKAYVELIESAPESFFRVRVGPFIKKQDLLTVQQTLMKEAGLMGEIIKMKKP